jgi:hypothetical protein
MHTLMTHPLVEEVVLVGVEAQRAVALGGVQLQLVGPAVALGEGHRLLAVVEVQLRGGE